VEGVLLEQGKRSGAVPGVCGFAATAEGGHVAALGRIYIAGKMTGEPDLNYPAFHRAARELRALGWHVENPAENPAPPCGSWAGYMRMALAQLVTCDAIWVLDGWMSSKGARLEVCVAQDLGMQFPREGVKA
jgi:hypothetical protein